MSACSNSPTSADPGRQPRSSTGRLDASSRAERWVILGPNGAGKTTLLQIAAATLHPTRGKVQVLGEQLGKATSSSSARASASPPARWRGASRRTEAVLDVVHDRRLLGHRPLERAVRGHRRAPREARARRVAARPPRRPPLRRPERRRAEARADRPVRDDRPRAAAARRARREPRPRRARGVAAAARRLRERARVARRWSWSPTTSRRSPSASPTRCCSSTVRSSRRGPDRRDDHVRAPQRDLRPRVDLSEHDGRYAARALLGG